jgi:hypothetical protein
MAQVLGELAAKAKTDPNSQAYLNEYLNGLPENLTRDQFLRDVRPGFEKFLEYRKMDALVKKNEMYFDNADRGPSLSSSYRGAPDTASLVRLSVLGDDDPSRSSVMENRIELGRRIQKRDEEVKMAAEGYSRFLGENGMPKAAGRPEQIIARRFLANTQAIEAARATGNDVLVDTILQQSLAGLREDLSRDGGYGAMASMSDQELMVVVRHHLDLDAVQGTTERVVQAVKAVPPLAELQASIRAKLEDRNVSSRDYNDLTRADGVLKEAQALASVGRIGLSAKEIAEYDRHRSLAPASATAEEDQIEMEKGKMLSTATKRLFSPEFLSNGVLNISNRDSVVGPSRGTMRAARNAIFSDTGLDALIPDKKTQDRIVMSLQGATTEQAATVLNDVLNTVAQPGIVKPRGLLSAMQAAIDKTLSLEGAKKAAPFLLYGFPGTSGYTTLSQLGAGTARAEGRLELVDPGHRTSFVAPESLKLAMLARAGIPEAREALAQYPAAVTEQKQAVMVAQTYDEVLQRLKPEDKKWMESLVPGRNPSADTLISRAAVLAFSGTDTKAMETAGKAYIDMQTRRNQWDRAKADMVDQALQTYIKAVEAGATSAIKVQAERLRNLGLNIGEHEATPSAPAAAATDE